MKKIISLFIFGFTIASIQAQQTTATAGGDASGSGGSFSYSIGQVVYIYNYGSDLIVAQGVQQPYEISTILGSDNYQINLMMQTYPNPTKDVLFIDNGNYQAMSGYSIKIVSLAGTVVYNQPITSQQVQISMNQFTTKGLYIAQIIDSNNAIVDSKKIVLE